MSVQDDKTAGQDRAAGQDEAAGQDDKQQVSEETGQLSEKPEPDDDAKQKAAEMMVAYEDRPTLVLPGSGGAISGTAVNDWIDEDGNPKYSDESGDDRSGDKEWQQQVEKDKTLNEELRKLADEENKGEKPPNSRKK
ncbi:MAG: hypothetical protein VYA67_02195 [Actinomycetota bacterium]|uniref:Uncharacterized protein n=1 Tax=Mycobacterium lentiflavum TaxID=141349 RepID=A0ABY3UM29_MYCLN|nr:hypothetical protein [Mycobacterium lentiflavum]MEE3062761.1 hypothetical protein [Actinomycetota bacterium]ULP40651.1 hypothetical protein MJO58_16915 [Mycobacterium lentiflavum]